MKGSNGEENEITMFLLTAIFDAVVDEENSSLRDFSARCIREYLRWSIKQTSDRDLQESPTQVRSLLRRIYALALHPNTYVRLVRFLGNAPEDD